ncbi:hypothetical protein ACWGLP_06075 [Streptomyces lydicus]|uniref:hypothetical protein n=1 Tax=Streptomyces lydicus TaxID=47763 RepID=UPI0037D39456
MPHENDEARQERKAHHAPDTAVDEVLAEFEEAETQVGERGDRGHQGEEGDALTTNEGAQEDTANKKTGGTADQRRTEPRP